MTSSPNTAHEAVIVFRPVTQGYAVACRCGYGQWHASQEEAEADKASHLQCEDGQHDVWAGMSGKWCIRCNAGVA